MTIPNPFLSEMPEAFMDGSSAEANIKRLQEKLDQMFIDLLATCSEYAVARNIEHETSHTVSPDPRVYPGWGDYHWDLAVKCFQELAYSVGIGE